MLSLLYTLVKLAKSHHLLLYFVCILYIVFVCLFVCLNCLSVFLTFCYHLWWIKMFIWLVLQKVISGDVTKNRRMSRSTERKIYLFSVSSARHVVCNCKPANILALRRNTRWRRRSEEDGWERVSSFVNAAVQSTTASFVNARQPHSRPIILVFNHVDSRSDVFVLLAHYKYFVNFRRQHREFCATV